MFVTWKSEISPSRRQRSHCDLLRTSTAWQAHGNHTAGSCLASYLREWERAWCSVTIRTYYM